ncbi:MAG TPA: ABC transporter permease [Pyrinomonadaceae bacterium]|nr:ABC transporter permease [Pyrinomonadaceae bacterium]
MSALLQPVTSLPAEPLIKIRPSRPWSIINLREIWAHRELFVFLVWRDLKVRYKQTLLGALWVILQPLLMTVVLVVFLGMIARVPSPGPPYSLFLYSALLPWTFFSNAVAASSFSLIGSAGMITKVYFPRALVPVAAVAVRLSDFLIAFGIMAGLLAYFRVPPAWSALLVPFLVAHLTILAIAVGLLLSAVNVKYRDVGTIIPVLIQLWMFASPIVYPAGMVPARWRVAYELNPLVGIIENFRSCLIGLPMNLRSLLISLVITGLLLCCAAFVFHHMEDEFADVV